MRAAGILGAFGRDRRGSVAIIFAISLFVVISSIGLAIDGARAYNVSARLHSALDSAALAAGKKLDEGAGDEVVEDTARDFFLAHWQALRIEGVTASAPKVTINRKGHEVNVAVDVAVAATFAQVAGISRFAFTRDATVVIESKRIEVAMALDITGSMGGGGKIEALQDAARDVIDTLFAGNPAPGFVRIALAPYSAAVNAGPYAATVSGGASVDGCVFERDGVNAYTEAAPSTEALGAEATPASPANGQYMCPSATIMPLTDDRNALRDSVRSYTASGWTAGHIGAAWAWYLLSPQWTPWPAANRGLPYTDTRAVKSAILMSDGMFNTSYKNGSQNSTDPTAVGSSPYQALQICAAMKARGITVYTVAFQAPPEAEALLQSCATPGASFNATSNNELRQVFREIANRIAGLRLSR